MKSQPGSLSGTFTLCELVRGVTRRGTGSHLPRFSEVFDAAGVDVSEEMLAIAHSRCPQVPLTAGDMRTLDLGSRFDVVVSLFSGIGYLTDTDELVAAVARMADHVADGGVLLVEGWVEPRFWLGSTVHAESARDDATAVARVARTSRDGMLTFVEMQYQVATAEGIVTTQEQHVLRLADPAEFAEAFAAAGMTFERLPHMLRPSRSVYVGRRAD